MSFLFNCCKSDATTSPQFQVQDATGKSVYVTAEEASKKSGQILKVDRSDYDELAKSLKQNNKWTDPLFTPTSTSLGNITGIPLNSQWKRISEIVSDPQLFVNRIQPADIIQGNFSDCYFLSAVAAVAEHQGYIQRVFQNQRYNPNGLYKVTLKIDGRIKQVIIDDYVPVNKINQPIFCQPNKNEIWVVLLEKAWAKIHGSYANISRGTPSDVFTAITYAPSFLLNIKRDPTSQAEIWKAIKHANESNAPTCFDTKNDISIDWKSIGLSPCHSYTLIGALEAHAAIGDMVYRVVKLRNPWKTDEWKGQANQNDKIFWNKVIDGPEKHKFLSEGPKKDGIFNMLFEDFCKYLSEAHFSNPVPNAVYVYDTIPNQRQALHRFYIPRDLQCSIQLNIGYKQQFVRTTKNEEIISTLFHKDVQPAKINFERSTLILAKGDTGQFVNGSLKYNQQCNRLKIQLLAGQYILYSRLEPSIEQNINSAQNLSIGIYSNSYVALNIVDLKEKQKILENAFLGYARKNHKKQYEDGKMWISWQLFFEKGGYAYIALSVSESCCKKFAFSAKQNDFTDLGYELSQQFIGKKVINLQVRPGEEKILIVHVKNGPIKTMKFPPPIDLQIQQL